MRSGWPQLAVRRSRSARPCARHSDCPAEVAPAACSGWRYWRVATPCCAISTRPASMVSACVARLVKSLLWPTGRRGLTGHLVTIVSGGCLRWCRLLTFRVSGGLGKCWPVQRPFERATLCGLSSAMKLRLPVTLTPDLVITVGEVSSRLTPSAGFTLAQKLIRASSRELVRQEVGHAHATISTAPRKQAR
jgi:hypothetical protein